MTGPFSRTTISSRGSRRRARAAALSPAATPPMTTSAIGRLVLFFFHLLHKAQDIEGLDLTVGVVAVNGVLLVIKDLEDGREIRHHRQLDITAIEVQQFDAAAGLPLP